MFRPLVVLRRVTQALMFVEGDPASEHSPKGSSGKEGALQKGDGGPQMAPDQGVVTEGEGDARVWSGDVTPKVLSKQRRMRTERRRHR